MLQHPPLRGAGKKSGSQHKDRGSRHTAGDIEQHKEESILPHKWMSNYIKMWILGSGT